MKALVGACNQEKAQAGAFSVIVKTGCGTDGALYSTTKYTAATPATTTGNKTIRVFVSELLQTIDQPNTNLATWHHLASSSINPACNGASAFNSSTFNQALVFLTKTNQW